MLNIAKYCVRYLWDHDWSPIHSPTFTVEFSSLFHWILIPNLIASMVQSITKSCVSSLKSSCKWIRLTFQPWEYWGGEEGRAEHRDWPIRDAASWFCGPPWTHQWLNPHPCATLTAPSFHPNKLILSGCFSQLSSWMRLSPSHTTTAMNLLRTFISWCQFLLGSC